jgi:nitrogen fixation NifU-like protein
MKLNTYTLKTTTQHSGYLSRAASLPSSTTSSIRTIRNVPLLHTPIAMSQLPQKSSLVIHKQCNRSYHERVIDHYEKPRNVGKFTKEEEEKGNVGTGLVGAPACGDVMRLQLKINNGVVEDAKFKTFGCGSAIASSSLATEWVKGKTVEECLEIKNTQIAQHLALPPVKLHCSMLAEDAIRAAIKDYQLKQQKGNEKVHSCHSHTLSNNFGDFRPRK